MCRSIAIGGLHGGYRVTPRYAELRWDGVLLSRGSPFLRTRFSFGGFPVTLTPVAALGLSSSVPAFLRGLAIAESERGAERRRRRRRGR
jgi:hypothetical protein